MKAKLHILLERDRQIKIINISDDYYMVTFTYESNYKFAFQKGPWVITNHYLLVQRWRPKKKCFEKMWICGSK